MYAGENAQRQQKTIRLLRSPFCRNARRELADQDANDGAPGEEEANHRRTRVDFVGQKQAQRRRL